MRMAVGRLMWTVGLTGLLTLAVGCAPQRTAANPGAGTGTVEPKRSNATAGESTTGNAEGTNGIESDVTPLPPGVPAASVQPADEPFTATIEGVAGALYTTAGWVTGEAETAGPSGEDGASGDVRMVAFTLDGFTLAGVHWRWPSSDPDPAHYIVTPAVISGQPYLVWCHLAAEQSSEDAPQETVPGQVNLWLRPTGPAQLWMTPWRRTGGILSEQAVLITDDVPPVWAYGQWWFSADMKDQSPAALAGGAWTGWFHWGHVSSPFHPSVVPSPSAPVVARPSRMYPAQDGIVMDIQTHVLGAPQGWATNLFYLDLSRHRMTGLASLSEGGGLFCDARVFPGVVLTGQATTTNASVYGAAFAFDEVTGARVAVAGPGSGGADTEFSGRFDGWSVRDGRVYDGQGRAVADFKWRNQVPSMPSAGSFGG